MLSSPIKTLDAAPIAVGFYTMQMAALHAIGMQRGNRVEFYSFRVTVAMQCVSGMGAGAA